MVVASTTHHGSYHPTSKCGGQDFYEIRCGLTGTPSQKGSQGIVTFNQLVSFNARTSKVPTTIFQYGIVFAWLYYESPYYGIDCNCNTGPLINFHPFSEVLFKPAPDYPARRELGRCCDGYFGRPGTTDVTCTAEAAAEQPKHGRF